MTRAVYPPGRYDLPQLAGELAAYDPTGGEIDEQGFLVIEFSSEPTVDEYREIAAIVDAHVPDEYGQLDALVAKARRVWRGEDTFTAPQAQKILAGLVLLVAKHLR